MMQLMMRSFFSRERPSLWLYLLSIPCVFLLLTFFAVYRNDLRLRSLLSTCDNHVPSFLEPVSVKPDFRVLISVFTTAWTFERRHLLRHVYSKSLWPADNITDYVDLRFVMCNITDEEHVTMVSLEIMVYNDIIVLNCTENVNYGKTYNFFSSLPDIFGHDQLYDYVVKTDDDTYWRLDKLLASLRDKPRNDVYYGLEIPCNGTEFNFWIPTPFMTGLGYVLSWDLVEWIAESEVPVNHTMGPEDMMLGWWLQMGEKGKNRYNNAPVMYDFRGDEQEPNCFRHDLTADTIAVHRLKENSRWATVLKYFNVTHGHIKPFKFDYNP
ncbi:Hexosyltransferase [Rhynchospora pubera]|uniref:Hexosyltransferase n=1 Tax=Rhynchospora pubera TaxID=906938 RepID=A0AAV8AM32_9POAL|nr:Hexosyltransferase [Rhynchospora pubera]KAJ4733866.1 Hexosyltransferase [Rhynchospora pubera]KAJ4821616.1 Hexosyltransferase [Rhynchospora pubera]